MLGLKLLLLIYFAAVQIFWFGYYFFTPLKENETPRTVGGYMTGVIFLPLITWLAIFIFIADIKIKK